MSVFSVPALWKKKNKVPRRLPHKEQLITLEDFINPGTLPWAFFQESDESWFGKLFVNLHTYDLIELFFCLQYQLLILFCIVDML